MRRLFIEGITTFLSIFIAILLLICLFNIIKLELGINDILYALIIEVGQMFFPFLIFVIVSNFIIRKLSKTAKGSQEKNFFIQFTVYVSFMLIITIVWSLGDVLLSGYSKEFVYYIKEFGLFMIFSPIACIINYFITRKYLLKISSSRAK